jgi:serine/threonine protein kinase
MNYPLISEYIEAVKSAEDNFEELNYLRPVLDEEGMPIMSAGGFSVVFKMKDVKSEKFFAVKCFTRSQDGRDESYKLIADELEYVSSNYLTTIKYYENELFVDTDNSEEDEFPVLLMDWVEGKTLDIYIKENINNQYALEMLAYQFNKMAAWLITQPFAHGDLKPDNIIMKEDGQLVLVDYDGIYVPAMKGQKAREIGSPGFRHPSRTVDVFDEHIDDFSIASIALALKAIAMKPVLWNEYGGNDRLLFSENDFLDLTQSRVITSMQPLMKDKELCTLYGVFMIAWAKNDLSLISFKLLNIDKKQKDSVQIEVLKYLKAKKYVDEEDYERAYRIFAALSQTSDSRRETIEGIQNVCGKVLGENGLGYMYAKGLYVKQDFSKAAFWFEKAARKKFPMALFNLAVCYTKGEGVKKDENEGARLFNLSGDLGFALAYTGYFDFEEDPLYNPSYVPAIKSYEEYTL